jgi:hypothetical protein
MLQEPPDVVPKTFCPFFHNDWWTCMPEPLSAKTGFGMNVAVLPARHAAFLTTYL